jgi:hypothetical protein
MSGRWRLMNRRHDVGGRRGRHDIGWRLDVGLFVLLILIFRHLNFSPLFASTVAPLIQLFVYTENKVDGYGLLEIASFRRHDDHRANSPK